MPTKIPLWWALPTLRIFQKSNISPIYDTCLKQEKKQVECKCSFESAMSQKALFWEFKHPTLNDWKEFCRCFINSSAK